MQETVSQEDPLDVDVPPGDEPVNAPLLGLVPELMRKAAFAGLGALFMTEETLRRSAGQMRLPREVLTAILAQAERTKDDLARVLTEEVRRFLHSEALRRELTQIFAGMSVEVNARIRLVPEAKPGQGSGPEVKVTRVRASRERKPKTRR
jgi:hypothetical protein